MKENLRDGDDPTLYEGLLKGIRDADEVAALVDAVSPGLRPRPHGQVVEQVAEVVVRVRRPEATFGVPSCTEIKIKINTQFVCSDQHGSSAGVLERRIKLTWSRGGRLGRRSLSLG